MRSKLLLIALFNSVMHPPLKLGIQPTRPTKRRGERKFLVGAEKCAGAAGQDTLILVIYRGQGDHQVGSGETEGCGSPDRDYKVSESHWRQVVRWKDQNRDCGILDGVALRQRSLGVQGAGFDERTKVETTASRSRTAPNGSGPEKVTGV